MSWTTEVQKTDRANSLSAIFFVFVAVIMVTAFRGKSRSKNRHFCDCADGRMYITITLLVMGSCINQFIVCVSDIGSLYFWYYSIYLLCAFCQHLPVNPLKTGSIPYQPTSHNFQSVLYHLPNFIFNRIIFCNLFITSHRMHVGAWLGYTKHTSGNACGKRIH